ncbi:MAG: hypothetical protein II998_02390 [Clostridia bacterium]|nr:hypothetical protein [Clostridia bacterium]
MNFKDAYKSMNNEIHGDKALMHRIINGETVEKKNFFLRIKPAYTVAVAAVFVVCSLTIYHGIGMDDYSVTNEKYSHDTSKDNTVDYPALDEADTSDNADLGYSGNSYNNGAKAEGENKTDSHQKDEAMPTPSVPETPLADSVPTEDFQQRTLPLSPPLSVPESHFDESQIPAPESSRSVLPANMLDDGFAVGESPVEYPGQKESLYPEKSHDSASGLDASVPRSGGTASGGGSSGYGGGVPYKSTSPDIENKNSGIIMSLNEYWKYLGVNILSFILVPDDLKISCPESVYVDELTQSDTATLTASSENGRKLTICTSKYKSLYEKYPDSDRTRWGDIYIVIISDGLTAEELSSVVISLTK